jgi:hypothetical protein
MNTVGGPRFGGSDTPTGGTVNIDGPTIRSRGASVLGQLASNTWINLGEANFVGLQGNEVIDLEASLSASSLSTGSVTLEFRLVHISTATVIATLPQSTPVDPTATLLLIQMSGGNNWSGSQSFRLEGRRLSGTASVDINGPAQFTAYAPATLTNPGFMTPAQVAQLNAGGGIALATTAPPAIGTSNSVGTGTTAARADHVHAHGNQGGGALHANATTTTDGFMPAADKVKVNGLANSASIPATGAAWTVSTLVQRDNNGDISTRRYLASSTGGAFVIGGSREMGINGAGFGFNVACTGPAFTPNSDPDLKENIEAVSNDPAALVEVLSAGQIQYDRVQDGVHALGFSAKALRDINPLWVVGGEALDPNGPPEDLEGSVVDEDGVTLRQALAVDPMAMMSSLFAAVRQLANDTGYLEARHEQALTRIAALEAEVAALTAA